MGNSYLINYLILSILFLYSSVNFPQYNPNKIDLIQTTATREFSKTILYKYLSSSDSTDIIAALISISHSGDTSFVQELIKMNFDKYGKWISFASGQIGNSDSVKHYLWERLYNSRSNFSEAIFSAIGKLGNQKDFAELINFYNEHPETEGIEEAILQFRIKNLTNDLSKNILIKEFSNAGTSLERKKKILFTLARLGSDSLINSDLTKVLIENHDNEMLQLALMNFRIQKYFPNNTELINYLFNMDNEVKIELVKALPYSDTTDEVLKLFTRILSDTTSNENVFLETIKAFQVKKWEADLLNDYGIESLLKQIIQNNKKSFIVSEAIKTYEHLFGHNELSRDTLLLKNLSEINLIQLFISEKNYLAFYSLSKFYERITDPKQKLNALEIFLKHNNEFAEDTNFIYFILKELKSDNPASISVIADGIDSNFISTNSDSLIKISTVQANKFKHNSDFIEALMSLVNLAGKISDRFQKELIQDLSDTKLYSLRKYLKKLSPGIDTGNKPFDNLSELINESFNYSGAMIKTNKGDIGIRFRPDFAPITVGNFVFLSKKNFYNGIKFHRVVPGFVIQTGDPTGTGWCGPGYEIVSEFSPEEYHTGKIGIASSGKDTEGSQFFIMQGYYPHLNGRYTFFAEIIKGLDVVMNIAEDDYIISVELLK